MSRLSMLMLVAVSGCASSSGHTLITGQTPASTQVTAPTGNYDFRTTNEARMSSHWVESPADEIWSRLPMIYDALSLEAGVVDAETHIYGTRGARVDSRIGGERISEFLDCGQTPTGTPAANIYSVRITAMTGLEEVSGGTMVRTQVVGQAQPRSTSGSTVRCTSTGDLEELIAEMLGAEDPNR
ncbi:MAG TPA: hypothetical protein VFI91_11785 [Longimicrobiaceae bacterium]|nr:hypothetical protein [Longimicrobiaceae bacterium]